MRYEDLIYMTIEREYLLVLPQGSEAFVML